MHSVSTLNLITRFTTLRERSAFMGMTGLTWGAGTILGPVIGGAFADSSATWRWAFYINLVILAALAPIYFIWLPSIPVIPEKTFIEKFLAMDWTGIFLNAGIYTTVSTGPVSRASSTDQRIGSACSGFWLLLLVAVPTLGTPEERLPYGLSLPYSSSLSASSNTIVYLRTVSDVSFQRISSSVEHSSSASYAPTVRRRPSSSLYTTCQFISSLCITTPASNPLSVFSQLSSALWLLVFSPEH